MALAADPSESVRATKSLVNYIDNLISGTASEEPSPIDLIIYHVENEPEEDDHRQSVLSGTSRHSKMSQSSRQNGKGSASSNRGIASIFERSTFTISEWMLLFVEMIISFAWFVIRDRRRVGNDLVIRGWTDRSELMDVYLKRAVSGLGAMTAGYVADSYIGLYPVALVNVALHFIVSSIMLMEEIIKFNDFDHYHGIVWQTVGWSFIPLKATDFARMVFGLEQIGRKKMKAVFLFIIMSVWLNERSCGGILILVIGMCQLNGLASVRISFILTGVATAVYIYNFRPDPNKITGIAGIGNKIVGCILTALLMKWKIGRRVKTKLWLDLALVKYDNVYVNKTKQLLRVYIMIIPTVGLLFFITSRSDFYVSLWHRMRPDGFFYYTGVVNGARLIAITSVGVISLVLIPIFLRLSGMKKSFLRRLVIGYLSAIFCFCYSSVILRNVEGIQPSLNLGLVRFINVGQAPVRIVSRELDLLHFNYTVEEKSGIIVAIDVKVKSLFKMMFHFGKHTNFTTMISVTPNEVQGYVALYPPDIIEISGFIPVWYSPPGYSIPYLARLYLSNMIRKTNATVMFVALLYNSVDDQLQETDTVYKSYVSEGNSSNLQLPAGTYLVVVLETDLSGNHTVVVGPGGVYTIVLFSSRLSNRMYQDTLVEENHISSYLTFGISIPYALTLVFAYASLKVFLYSNTPEGLEGLCFGFLEALEHSTAWALWIGYLTWHATVTSLTISIYAIVLTFLFFFCLFISTKYDEFYRW